MALPFSFKNPFKKKNEFDVSQIKSTVTKTNGQIQTTVIIPAKVTEVGDDEAVDGFSYKYSFKNPISGKMQEATDYLQFISQGEQLFDVGDDVNVIFTAETTNGEEFNVTRQIVFPKILKRRENFRRLGKIAYVLFFIFFMLFCCFFTIKTNVVEENTDNTTIESEEVEDAGN